jgi:hypothetical protein
MRTKSFSLVSGNHLREDAVHGVGMDERNLEPEKAGPWDLVDKLGSLCLQVPERIPHVGGLERDVVHRLTSPPQETLDGRVLPRRREELHSAVAHEKRCGFDPLRGQRVAELHAGPEQPLVGRNRLVEIPHGNSHMVNAADFHAAMLPAVPYSVAHGEHPDGADGLGGLRLRLDVREQGLELGAIERLLLEQRLCDSIEGCAMLEE